MQEQFGRHGSQFWFIRAALAPNDYDFDFNYFNEIRSFITGEKR
jgi:hypothetical protein